MSLWNTIDAINGAATPYSSDKLSTATNAVGDRHVRDTFFKFSVLHVPAAAWQSLESPRISREEPKMGGGANMTDPSAATIHGTNPQFLVHNILRQRIYESAWWKEHCFALSGDDKKTHSSPLIRLNGLLPCFLSCWGTLLGTLLGSSSRVRE